ncbi:uncharacterized protein LOC117121798 [Anneissia japonica]|uniref:uncharacterized protein LOC117121798 n=1 Tax=Anneissia japonica TaxID=1529436 RepID=UPI001425AFBB|nr:uncharacterized protein LOC117121798 [Anneissia japonica]
MFKSQLILVFFQQMVYKQEGASYPYVTRAKLNKDFDVGMRPLGVEFHRQATDRYNASGLPDEVEVDCENNAEDGSLLNAKKEEKLQCPACFKEFPLKEHHLLVEHMDTCS